MVKGNGYRLRVKGNCFSCVIFVVNSAAHSLGLSELSTHIRGYASLTPAYGLATPSEFGLLSPIKTGGYASSTTCLWSTTPSVFGLLSPINTGVALRFTPACGLSLLRSFSYSLPSKQGLHYVSPPAYGLSALRACFFQPSVL